MTNDDAGARPVNLSASGPPSTTIDREPDEALDALLDALAKPSVDRRDAVADVVARWPRFLDAWARLGDLARDDVEAYACYRVGYHRGLDRLRASGWRGSGYVRWSVEENRGFLRSVRGLGHMAARIGEDDEAARCAVFLDQLDPGGVPAQG
ncbi:MAG TPA: DUF3151 family protein [Acidimicrobiales bacterium]|nr:DUF3151 family protein [Acidimicrobiales bacterium]